MKPLSRRIYALTAIALAAVLFVAVNIVADNWLRTARIDLTENGLFTLASGTRVTLKKIPEPITLRFYYSREVAANYAQVRAYAARVRDLLQEYAALAHGKLILQEIDPEPYTPAEDEAVSAGLTGVPTQEGETVYFGLAAANGIGGKETIPYFDQGREQYLEYDLTSLIYKLSTPAKPKLGIITSLPMETGAGGMMAMMQGNAQPYMIYQQLHESFDVQMLDQDSDRIPADISTLMIVHPKPLRDKTLYAIDQFVMRGGHAIVFVDPLSELANASGGQQPGTQANTSSDLEPLLKTWGVAYDPSKVVGDGARAQRVRMSAASDRAADYIIWLRLAADNPDGTDFSPTDPVTANLKQLNLATVGALKPIAHATTHFTPLVISSAQSELLDTAEVRITSQPQDLLSGFQPSGEKYTLAARISGPVNSAFPLGAPKEPLPVNTAPPAPLPAAIASASNIDVIIMADSDIFDDRFWVQVQNVLGQRMAVPTADNAAFVINAVENMMGSSDLISLRTRAPSSRPFTVVETLRREAEKRFLAEEKDLQTKVSETEGRLRQLESQGGAEESTPGKAPNAGTAKNEMLSPAQQAEIEKFRRQLADTRGALRAVQANLRKNVEDLGARLAFINIALVPILVAAFAIGLAWLRRRRRAKARGL